MAHVVSLVPGDLTLRWAALLHDIGKPVAFTLDEAGRGHFKGHAPLGGPMAQAILREMGAPEEQISRVGFLVTMHMARLSPDETRLRQLAERHGLDAVTQLLALQRADMQSKGVPGEEQTERFIQVEEILKTLSWERVAGP